MFEVIQAKISRAAIAIRNHLLSRKAVSSGWTAAQRERYSLFQLGTATIWPGFLAGCAGRVQNPALQDALRLNACCEIGANEGSMGHVSLALSFCLSQGIAPDMLVSWPTNPKNQASMVNMVGILLKPEMTIAGWMYANEFLAGVMFQAFLPAFAAATGPAIRYMQEHVDVDGDEHAKQIWDSVEECLSSGHNLQDFLRGLNLAIQARIDYLEYIQSGMD